MMHEVNQRSFSIKKHAVGEWHTAVIAASNPFVRWCMRQISFKYRELHAFAKRSRGAGVVVDFGAGSGAYSRFFLDCCNATVIAVDWAWNALRSISPSVKGKVLPLCADLHYLPLKSGCIDGLFSIDTLGHLSSQEKALNEINRVCRSGAPLFLHSECSDYRTRWPDRKIIEKYGGDPIAEQDGHIGIRTTKEMRSLYEQRFSVIKFYSPAGIAGWLLGYPEKYWRCLMHSGMFLHALAAAIFSLLKKIPGMKVPIRLVNVLTNWIELFLGVEGGGSCFAHCRCIIPEPRVCGQRVPSIDIVIATFRRSSMLSNALNSVATQCIADDRIFIVWQGKETPDVFENRRIFPIYCRTPNLPLARNIGIAAGGNPIVLFLDDDCIARPGLLDAHRACYDDPDIGAVAGFVDDPLFSGGEASVPSRLDITTGELVQNFNLAQSGPSISVMGTNMSFRRSAIEEIRGFDTNYRSNAVWEEIDASFRLLNRKYAIYYCSSAKVVHCRCPSGGCRSDGEFVNMFYTFANTAYFACTFARVKDLGTWVKFWKRRLEYLSRIPQSAKASSRPRHNLLLVMAGVTGAVHGTSRFLIYGKRHGMPRQVIDLYNHEGRGGRP